MFLSVREMEFEPVRFRESFEPGRIDFGESELRQTGLLVASGVASLIDSTEEIRIQGNLEVALEADCDRCLAPAAFSVRKSFDLFYRPNKEVDPTVDEIAIVEEETELGFYEGDGLELLDALKEQILLDLPMQRLCRPDCRGICPQCGENRNEAACRCTQAIPDDRWLALRKLG